MDQRVREKLERQRVNVADALLRFMNNDQMYIMFLQRFPEDPSMGELEEALAAGDAVVAFRAAHTLKGVAANLSLEGVQQTVVPVVEILRGGSIDGLELLMEPLRAEYQAIIKTIKEL